jgi:hypothetical protein
VAVTILLAFGLSCQYIFQHVPLSWWNVFGAHGLALLAAILVLVVMQQLPAWTALQPIVRVLLIGFLGTGTFMLALFMLRPIETRERIVYVAQRFRARREAA